jgi:hypothetical protein
MNILQSSAASSSAFKDEPNNVTPFNRDAITNILSEAKPYRNVVKRYWTEEEVS